MQFTLRNFAVVTVMAVVGIILVKTLASVLPVPAAVKQQIDRA